MESARREEGDCVGEEEEEDAEEDGPHNDGDITEDPIMSANDGGSAVAEPFQRITDGGDEEPVQSNSDGGEEEEEPIQSVLAEFSKEELIALLSEAAKHHNDVAARVRSSAEVDPSHRKIFVHGLNWGTTSEMLFEEFVKYGEIEDCRVIVDKFTGRSKGYGFVFFRSCRAARQALKEPQKVINDRMTSSQMASVGPVGAALPQKPLQSEYAPRKIFVSNVGEELDPEKLKVFFSKYGEIEEGPLGLDRESGKPRGFCLFTYKTVESAKLALAEPHKKFECSTLHCQQAIDGPKHHNSAAKNQQFVDNVASSVVDSTMVPPYMQGPPMLQQLQPMNVDPSAVGQALTTILAQGGGMHLLGAMGAATGLPHPAMVPGFRGPVMRGGYGMVGAGGMEGPWNQGGYPADQMRWWGPRRAQHGPRPYMG